jgi:cell division protein FtsW
MIRVRRLLGMREGKKLPADFSLFLVTVVLFAIGILMVFDASFARAGDMKMTGYDSWYFVKRQLAFGIIGLAAMFWMMRVNLESVRRWSLPLLGVSMGLLVLVLIPGIGKESNGAVRWFGFGPIRFQPSELAKLSVVLYLASALSGQKFRIRNFQSGLLIHLLLIGLMGALIMKQPDMGTASVIVINAFVMLFVAGALKRHLMSIAGVGAAAAGLLVAIAPYRMARMLTFMDPMHDYYGRGYQVIHSLIAISSGGVFGQGLCEGREKFYLPAAQTDFIFSSTVAEEAGLIGGFAIIALFLLLTYRGLSVANRAKSPYYTLLATGLTSMISVQAAINVAVVTATMPATGVPLPFLSYGGSALLFALMSVGLLLNVSRNLHTAGDTGSRDAYEDHFDWGRDRRTHLSRPKHSRRTAGRRPGSRTPVRR